MAQSCRLWHNGAMMRPAILPLLIVMAFLASGHARLARAQDTGAGEASATSQTDRSEAAWRKSKKKHVVKDPFSHTPNTASSGVGAPLPPLSAMQRLPEESRRHLKRQRAKVIASMKFGKDGQPELGKNAAYQPSEAAKNDPALAADEEEAWQVILTDLQGGSGKGGQTAPGGPHKVAVAGRGGDKTAPVLRGGSAQSAAEIMARLKGLKAGAAPANGQQEPGQKGQTGAIKGAANTPTRQNSKAGEKPPSAVRGGSAQSASAILSSIKSGSGTPSGSQSGQGQKGGQSDTGGKSGAGKQGSQDGKKTQAAADPLDPLDLPAADAAAPDTSCSQSSAYAYLQKNKKREDKPAGCK